MIINKERKVLFKGHSFEKLLPHCDHLPSFFFLSFWDKTWDLPLSYICVQNFGPSLFIFICTLFQIKINKQIICCFDVEFVVMILQLSQIVLVVHITLIWISSNDDGRCLQNNKHGNNKKKSNSFIKTKRKLYIGN